MFAKVMTGNSGWDVVFPSNSFIVPMREMGCSSLDHAACPIWEISTHSFARRSGIPNSITPSRTCTALQESCTLAAIPASAVLEPSLDQCYQGRMTMLDDSAEVFAVCLKRDGYSINSANPAQLRSSRDLAEKQKPLLRAYLNEEVRDQVVAGDVLVAQMWTQVAQVAIESAPNMLNFAYPSEGFALYADVCAILRESEHAPLAHEFINYLLRPQVAAAIAVETRGATVNAAARAILPKSLRDNPSLYPTSDILARGEWFRPLPQAAQKLRDRYWTEIKSS